MIKFSSKLTYPKADDSKKAYQLYIKNLKKKLKTVDDKKKTANVHFTCDGSVIRTEVSGSKDLVAKIEKIIYRG